eukprot:3782057-Ditylum_brightwellii.AAC.1
MRKTWANNEEIGNNMQRKSKDHTRIHMLNPKVRDTVHSNFNHSRVTMASFTIPTTNDYKPGGTMNIVQGDVVG